MIKRALFAVVISCFLSSPSWSAFYGPYALTAPIAIDGDTINADVQVWPDLTVDTNIRVRGVDTPELRAPTACERDLAVKAKAFTSIWLLTYQPILISSVAPDKYSGRYDAVVTGIGGAVLATDLINAGHGVPYSGGARKPWCQ